MLEAGSPELLQNLRAQVRALLAVGGGAALGEDVFPALAGRVLAMYAGPGGTEDAGLSARLDAIPSETTPGERRLLYNYFAELWDGRGDVLEVGPFLGGTSRAICLGMLANPTRDRDALFHTYDKFTDYFPADALLAKLEPMFAAGLLDDAARQAILRTTSFKEVYEQLHRDQEYFALMRFATGVLPDRPEEADRLADRFAPPPDRAISAVFVDGAKSWYGMKDFMRAMLPCTKPGAMYLFQDYGAHTCFWVPVFLEIFRAHFRLICFTDHTYVFRYERDLSPMYLGAGFPDAPEGMDTRDMELIFRRLQRWAVATDNHYLIMNFQLQYAAALAYLGFVDEARRRIVTLLDTPFASRYQGWIQHALSVPTYTPRGNVSLY